MLVVWSWLQELVELPGDVGPDQAAAALTASGLEVEEQTATGDDFSGVVIAEVVAKRRHPDADKLTLVDVIDAAGGAATEVVCGAPNVPEPGGQVLWAQPGARLPGGMEIAARKVKGIESKGMLVSEQELGLSDEHDGIIVLEAAERTLSLGAEAANALGLRDVVFDIGVPANRADALGHLGVARELAALCSGRLRPPSIDLEPLTDASLNAEQLVRIRIEEPERCSRYVGRVIDGLQVRPSPRWLRRRLLSVGVRPVSNLVDVTNYVMFEQGQPLHAFDYGLVAQGSIIVRRAAAGEKMVSLDDIERELTSDDLLICDADRPVAIAGVMGGSTTEVSDSTTRVLLESAHFSPTSVRRTAKRLGLHSESSFRFERHVDPNGADRASARAAQLLAQLGGGKVARGVVDCYPTPVEPVSVYIRPQRATQLTGVDFDEQRVRELLSRIQLDVRPGTGDDGGIEVLCPSFRPDLTREVDLIEELIRQHGFDAVPATLPLNNVTPTGRGDARGRCARRGLVAAGMTELMLFGFTSTERTKALRLPEGDRRAQPLSLLNPLRSDQSVMRTSLLPNLLGAVRHNLNHGNTELSLFEVGTVFWRRPDQRASELPEERIFASGVISGARDSWLSDAGTTDFFDAKGCVQRLLVELLGEVPAVDVSYRANAEIPFLHPGVAAEVVLADGTVVGVVGELHPETRRALDIEPACFGFELDLSQLPQPSAVQMTEIPRYPAIVRDLSFFVEQGVPASRVREVVRDCDEPLVERLLVLEDYRDPDKVPAGKKGMLWSLTYRSPERTLTDAEVDATHERIVERLLSTLCAQRR